ncbi:MAG: Bax inhibitor-1/YccA family protein [Nitrosospira sp.]|nr:Bax inhibitor-1/YccA family protein [Nitrosospira sp.]MDW7642242.1 Bax inhibitor-1/YccA family protein [Nitrosomonadaceae bacterium]MBI0408084.1 Bax inhibitor-1/YccA family protein [Nitrosospira sp.]MBI0414057.1 Bax inhibitor-1/YccA family protein [Nitrosospira sp.]MBI0415477.1 Bax inhibitor-1/YccA family protein [Nitrosospira sp.]
MQPELRYSNKDSQIAGLAIAPNKVLRSTYWMLGLTMIPTILGALLGVGANFSFLAQSPIMGPLLMLAVMMGLMFAINATRNSVWGIVLLFGFTFVAGWWLGPMLQYALHFKNGAHLVGTAAAGTGIIFFTLAGIATVTRKDFGFMGNFLFVGLILLIIASVANLFFAMPAASLAISGISVLLFSGFILFDVSRIIHGGETNYVMATLGIYLSIYNLFVSLLQLLMAFSGDRD